MLKRVLNNVLDPELNLDRIFRALADPGRRRMLERLSEGPASVSELGKPMAMSLAAVLQHVQLLEASGLVQSRKLGRTRTCGAAKCQCDGTIERVEFPAHMDMDRDWPGRPHRCDRLGRPLGAPTRRDGSRLAYEDHRRVRGGLGAT